MAAPFLECHCCLHAVVLVQILPVVSGERVHDQLLCDGSSGVPLMRAGVTDDSSGTPMLESFSSGFVADMSGELPAAAGVSGEHSALQVSPSARGQEADCAQLWVLRLRRQARSRFFQFVGLSDSASSSRLGHLLHSPGLGGARVNHMNSCFATHDARANSWGTLHAARINSGTANSYRCMYNSCGGFRGGTKPMSMNTRCQDRCPAVEKLVSLQQAPGRLHVETWAGRDGNPACRFRRLWKSCRGVKTW